VPGIRRRALVDVDAFLSNISDDVLDARADAYGHGLALLAPVALSAGVREVVVSNQRDAGVAIAAGFAPGAVWIDRDATGASVDAYGLTGSGRSVLSLIGEVVALKRVEGGAGVSYGYTYRTSSPTTLALVALGYADGVPRLASNRARVRVHEATHPLVGRIAMDQLVLDIGDASIDLGADAVLFGDTARGEPSAVDWAGWTEREPLALTAGIAARVTREAR
jgi:alanine racemase